MELASNSLGNEVSLYDRPCCNISYGMSRASWSPSLTPTPVTNLCWEGSPVRFGAEPISVTAWSLHWGCASITSVCRAGLAVIQPHSVELCTPPLGEPPVVLVPLGQMPSKHTCFFPCPPQKKKEKRKKTSQGPSFVTISLWTKAGSEHLQAQGSVTPSRAQQPCTDKQQEIEWGEGISQVCYFYCLHYLQILQNQAHLQRKQIKGKGIAKEEVMEGQKHQIFIGRWAWNFVLPEG